MAQTIATERRELTGAEFEAVNSSHYPAVTTLDRPALVELARALRGYRDAARDILHQRRRQARGKPGPGAAGSAPGEARVQAKKQHFAAALKRVNPRIAALDAEAKRARTTEMLAQALAAKRGARRHHPGAGHTASGGMADNASTKGRKHISGGRVGSVSKAGRRAQARRDG
jgi:hypothetical protein